MKTKVAIGLLLIIFGKSLSASEDARINRIDMSDFTVFSSKGFFALGDDVTSLNIDFDHPKSIIKSVSGAMWNELVYENEDINIHTFSGWPEIIQIILLSQEYTTKRGIHIGSTRDELFSVYLSNEFQPFRDGFIAFFPMASGESHYPVYLYFEISNDLVSSIEFGRTVD